MIHLCCLLQQCNLKNLVVSDISFMAIFTEVSENECIMKRHVCDIDTLHNSL